MILQGAFNLVSKFCSFENVENLKARNFNWFFNLELSPSKDIDKSLINIHYEKMKWLQLALQLGSWVAMIICNPL
jgi:hypothetical protein